ncbi:MAG TPA: protease pro-enzyme activation domain-containing protein, partial [Candidatus Acidoferrum sp.]|nr:protease pro-enzyme activation domain-containing protein [Candidatus Acidoferrum sp.]
MRTVVFPAVLLLALAGRAQERTALTGHRPEAVAQLQPLRGLPAATRMDLAIGLPLRNRTGLTNFLRQLYDPANPNYHRYLTTEQFTERFGPTEQDYQKVMDFVEGQGLKVTGRHPNRLLLDVSGSARDIERAFQVKMQVYQHPTEARTFFAPDAEPSVEAGVPVLEISGLNNYAAPHPMSLHIRAVDRALHAMPGAGSGSGGTYLGNDLRAAYVPNIALDGTGQSVGLFELDGYYANDITSYESLAGLPAVPLTNVLINGFSGNPDTNANEVAEVSLDIEMAIAMAPRLSNVMVYEASTVNLTIAGINDILNRMATDNQAKQLSSSWSWGAGTNATGDQIFLQYAAQGQSFFEASGDSGAYGRRNPISEPSDDPYIIIVGGTTLTTSGPRGSWVSEKVWSWFPNQADASSGGISTLFAIPSWQQGVSMTANKGSTTMRNIPDVALTGDNIFVVYNNGAEGDFGGTSCAAPLWAAFTALVNQHGAAHGEPAVGFINPAVYAIGQGANYAADFHDITNGNNTNSTSRTNFIAVAGYDLCTGWGTPNGSNMINALLPGLSPITPTLAWTNPTAVIYGAALSASQLNATANVPGAFAYNPAAGAVLHAGANVLSVVFTPNDTFDYNSVAGSASLVVTPAPLTVTASNATRVYGQANPAFTAGYSGFVNGDGLGVLTGSPSLSTTATTASSVAGSPYAIVAANGTLSASNYTFLFNNGQLTITPASVSNAVSSSANPSLTGSNVTFTATLTAVSPGSGTPTGTVQFYADSSPLGSPVALVGGVAGISTSSLLPGAHVISAQYPGDGNFFGSTASLSPGETINSLPIATNIVLQRYQDSGAKISVAALLADNAGPNSGVLTLISADPTSTNGGPVAISSNWI